MSELRSPWRRPSWRQRRRLEVEARREIQSGHALFGECLTCIAACDGCDDVIFECADGSFAIVHLTYARSERPPWPNSVRVGSYLALEAAMDQHEH